MIIVTANHVAGKRIVRTFGLVRGNTIRARHIGKDIMAAFRNIVGGEVTEYTKLLAESREQALDRLVKEAEGLGANAVISLLLQTSMIQGGAAELLAYGTAVVVEDEASSSSDRPDWSTA
ncbi:MAG: YbjQ family protein [Vicinamibacterales bacterium]|nr:YbjQ family protein [Vicinamibacterales bacterium]RUA03918.1 MAG: YbjQ family protein [Candidatus Neomarinimicrobiota bacterium]